MNLVDPTQFVKAMADRWDVYENIGTQLVKDTAREDIADRFAGGAFVLLMLTAVPSLVWFSRLAA